MIIISMRINDFVCRFRHNHKRIYLAQIVRVFLYPKYCLTDNGLQNSFFIHESIYENRKQRLLEVVCTW